MPENTPPVDTPPPVNQEPWVPLPPDEWTEPERWAWERFRAGRVADFNERYGNFLDPKNEAAWTNQEKERRGLRADFLRTVLLCEPWRSAVAHPGVGILGAYFADNISLISAIIKCNFSAVFSLFNGNLNLITTSFEYSINLDGSFFSNKISMDGTQVRGALFMRIGINVGGQVSLEEAKFEKKFSLAGC